jgi:hypothetical protein
MHSNKLESFLAMKYQAKRGQDGHQLWYELDSNEVERTEKREENDLYSYLTAIVLLDLLRLIHALEQQHVDHGWVSDEIHWCQTHEDIHRGKFVRPHVAILVIHACPVDPTAEEDVGDVVHNLTVSLNNSEYQGK